MIIVRDVFIAKPGMASTFAKMAKEEWHASRVMTDMTGVYNKVVVESEYDTLAAYETEVAKYMKAGSKKKEAPGHVDLYTQGKREIYRVW